MSDGTGDAAMRLDKWLWTTRFFRHRAQAAKACDAGLVFIGNAPAKPANMLRAGAVVSIGEPGLRRVVRAISLPGKRLDAAGASACYVNLETPPTSRREARKAWIDELLKPEE